MRYPNIKFRLNKALDISMANEFLGQKAGGIDFTRGIIDVHPELRPALHQTGTRRKKEIRDHFNHFYKEHDVYLKRRVREFNHEWKAIENTFFKEVGKIFNGYSFPKGKYIGYLSIIDCNPRYLDTKEFQIFYFHPLGSNYVTAHEMMHFIFYSYVQKKHAHMCNKWDPESGIFWDLAEIFNSVILGLPRFKKLLNVTSEGAYPNHKKFITPLRAYWNKTQDIDQWILRAVQYLKK